MADQHDRENAGQSVLSLNWTFGLNKNVTGGVHSLTDGIRKIIFYASAHTGVLYDYSTGKQYLLQGHVNAITTTAVTSDKRWIATCDKGVNATILVWDTMPYLSYYENSRAEMGTAVQTWNITKVLPVKTIFDPHGGAGVICADFSADGKVLVTLGADTPQTLAVWDWSAELDHPVAIITIKGEQQKALRVNADDSNEIVTTGPNSVYFYTWEREGGDFTQHTPILSPKDFKYAPSGYTYSMFLPNSSLAVTGTVEGDLVVWNDRSLNNLSGKLPKGQKSAMKFVRLHNSPINFITTVNQKYIITGGEDGFIKIHDLHFRIIFWIEKLKAGPLASISFASAYNYDGEPTDYFLDDVEIPEFFICTKQAKVLHVYRNPIASTLGSPASGGPAPQLLPSIRVLVEGQFDAIRSILSHPNKPIFYTAGDSCYLQMWDYTKKQVINARKFELIKEIVPSEETVSRGATQKKKNQYHVEPLYIKAMDISPDGTIIAIGFHNSGVQLINAETLEDIQRSSWTVSNTPVSRIKFASDSDYVAISDENFSVSVLKRELCAISLPTPQNRPTTVDDIQEQRQTYEWVYLGKYKSHYKEIVGLLFMPRATDDEVGPRLLTVSHDRHVSVFDLGASTIVDGLKLKAHEPIEQTSIPLGIVMYPSPPGKETAESFIAVPNSDFKFKLYNAGTLMCRKTILGPVYGNDTAVTGMSVLPNERDKAGKYLAFHSKERIVGVVKMPLDGNPHRAMGLIAHPGEIAGIACSHDGRYLFTAGLTDNIVNMWSFHPNALDVQALLGGDGYEPFLRMLDETGKGKESPLYREMEDYFFYAQLKSQGEDTKDDRIIKDTIPISQIPSIMQAIGYYHSEQEMVDMLNEVKYSRLEETGEFTEEVTLDEIVRLYVNHRPVQDMTVEEISETLILAKELDKELTGAKTNDVEKSTEKAKGNDSAGRDSGLDDTVSKFGLLSLVQQYGETMSKADFDFSTSKLMSSNKASTDHLPAQFTIRDFIDQVLGMQPTLEQADAQRSSMADSSRKHGEDGKDGRKQREDGMSSAI